MIRTGRTLFIFILLAAQVAQGAPPLLPYPTSSGQQARPYVPNYSYNQSYYNLGVGNRPIGNQYFGGGSMMSGPSYWPNYSNNMSQFGYARPQMFPGFNSGYGYQQGNFGGAGGGNVIGALLSALLGGLGGGGGMFGGGQNFGYGNNNYGYQQQPRYAYQQPTYSSYQQPVYRSQQGYDQWSPSPSTIAQAEPSFYPQSQTQTRYVQAPATQTVQPAPQQHIASDFDLPDPTVEGRMSGPSANPAPAVAPAQTQGQGSGERMAQSGDNTALAAGQGSVPPNPRDSAVVRTYEKQLTPGQIRIVRAKNASEAAAQRAPIWKPFMLRFQQCAPGCDPIGYSAWADNRRSCHNGGRALDVFGMRCQDGVHMASNSSRDRGRFAELVTCMAGPKPANRNLRVKDGLGCLWHNGANMTTGHKNHAHFTLGCYSGGMW